MVSFRSLDNQKVIIYWWFEVHEESILGLHQKVSIGILRTFEKKLSLWHFSKAGFPVSQNSYGKSPTKKIGKFYQEIAWIEIDNTNQQISGESLSPGKTWKLEMYESLTFFKWENICLQGE